jgi:hypothetical protein
MQCTGYPALDRQSPMNPERCECEILTRREKIERLTLERSKKENLRNAA